MAQDEKRLTRVSFIERQTTRLIFYWLRLWLYLVAPGWWRLWNEGVRKRRSVIAAVSQLSRFATRAPILRTRDEKHRRSRLVACIMRRSMERVRWERAASAPERRGFIAWIARRHLANILAVLAAFLASSLSLLCASFSSAFQFGALVALPSPDMLSFLISRPYLGSIKSAQRRQ